MQYTIGLIAGLTLFLATGIGAPDDPVKSSPVEKHHVIPIKPVSFRLAKPDKPLILLETMVNGHGPFVFVLDTGAGGTIISPKLAQQLDIQPLDQAGPEKATGAGGEIDIQFGHVKTLRVGTVERPELKVGILDLTGIERAIETDLDGILGYNFLKDFKVTIDYPRQTVAFE